MDETLTERLRKRGSKNKRVRTLETKVNHGFDLSGKNYTDVEFACQENSAYYLESIRIKLVIEKLMDNGEKDGGLFSTNFTNGWSREQCNSQ